GAEHFALFNGLKVLAPALVAGCYVSAWLAGTLTVAVAVWSFAAVNGVVVAAAIAYLVRRHGVAWPRVALARRTLWYGAKAQGTGLVVTVGGLLVFLRAGGIEAAAWVSTAAYATVFACALVAYRRAAKLPWRAFTRRALEAAT